MKLRVSDLLVFGLLFIFVAAFPVDRFNISVTYQYLIRICLLIVILVYYIYICFVNRINIFKFYNWKRMLLFFPFLLVCFSNLIAAGINKGYSGITTMSDGLLSIVIIYHFLQAVVEEFLFRLFIQGSLIRVGSIKRIMYGALIFALFHLLNIVSIRTVDGLVAVLIQVVYSFGLGILLGFIYEYTYSLPACIIFHFAFNFFNTVLYQYLGCNSTDGSLAFYLTAVIIGVVVAIYTFIIYWFILRRNDRYFKK